MAQGSTPTLASVRAKIEKLDTDALGAQELHQVSGGERIQEITAAGTCHCVPRVSCRKLWSHLLSDERLLSPSLEAVTA